VRICFHKVFLHANSTCVPLRVGDEASIRAAVPLGVDTFDSTFPTRAGRHGLLLSRTHGRINIRNTKNATNYEPPCGECACELCTHHSVVGLYTS
jgi:queuine tRNA-ribosyltransferase